MFKKLFSKKSAEKESVVEEKFPVPVRSAEVREFLTQVENWNLDAIRLFLAGKNPDYKVNECRVIAIMHRFNFVKLPHKSFPKGRKEFESTDLPQRSKKLLSLVKIILEDTQSLFVVDEVDLFIQIYEDEIKKYDLQQSDKNYETLSKKLEIKRVMLTAKNEICQIDRCTINSTGKNSKAT